MTQGMVRSLVFMVNYLRHENPRVLLSLVGDEGN